MPAALFCLAAVVFLTIHAYYNGQIGKNVQGRLATATPGIGLLAMVMGAAAILLRGSSIAYWAPPALSILGFAIMFGFLNKYGKFHRTETQ